MAKTMWGGLFGRRGSHEAARDRVRGQGKQARWAAAGGQTVETAIRYAWAGEDWEDKAGAGGGSSNNAKRAQVCL